MNKDDTGFGSSFERDVAEQFEAAGVEYEHEPLDIPYTQPSRPRIYRPDFVLVASGIIIEVKGILTSREREKLVLVKRAHPDLDLRIVLSQPDLTLGTRSQTKHRDWCEAEGIPWSGPVVPMRWLIDTSRSASAATDLLKRRFPQPKRAG